MAAKSDILTFRESLDKICKIPDKIISVYTLEQHVWAGGHLDPDAFRQRKPELKTIQEFQIDPVRHFLNDIFRKMAAPYRPDRVGDPIGQGYWIQAEFGSGKSHLLCFLASLALGSKDSWDLVREKEQKAGRGKRESLYQFWEEGLEAKSSAPNKGIFVVVKTLVGSGGRSADGVGSGRRLLDYILDEAKEQLLRESEKIFPFIRWNCWQIDSSVTIWIDTEMISRSFCEIHASLKKMSLRKLTNSSARFRTINLRIQGIWGPQSRAML